jgi:hypothetical protein
VKYFFQFEFWHFNNVPCDTADLPVAVVSVFGVQKTCGNFFVNLLTELLILLTAIAHRGALRRLGLWEVNFASFHARDEELISEELTSGVEQQPALSQIEIVDDARSDIRLSPSPVNIVRDYIKQFISYLTDRKQIGADFYTAFFSADFLAFVLTIVFWTSFSGDFATDANLEFLNAVFSQNSVPPLFVAIAMVNFCLIILDRAIYISKSVAAKFILHVVTVIAYNAWVFFVLPVTNREPISTLTSLQIWYFVKCVYWYFSGLQLKSGYPQIRISSFFMKAYGQMDRYLFMAYRAVPFVWELRAIVDWSLSDTTLSLYSWLKFEDILSNIYLVKCDRMSLSSETRRFGEPQNPRKRYKGCIMLTVIVIVLWFPLLLLSIPGTTKSNPVVSATVRLYINGYEPLYVQSVTRQYLVNFTEAELDRRLVPSFYQPENVQKVQLQNSSTVSWSITPPAKQELIRTLKDLNSTTYLTFAWHLDREDAFLGAAKGSRGQLLDQQTRLALASPLLMF